MSFPCGSGVGCSKLFRGSENFRATDPRSLDDVARESEKSHRNITHTSTVSSIGFPNFKIAKKVDDMYIFHTLIKNKVVSYGI